MKSKNLNHSKIKNPAVLFELLVRQITMDTLEGIKESNAVNILRKYFKPTTELGKELQLYRQFFESKKLTEIKAVQFIDLMGAYRKKLNERRLSQEKYELIRDLKEAYALDSFLKVKIPNYKIYASIYRTFLSEVSDIEFSNIKDVAEARFSLIEHLVKETAQPKVPTENSIMEVFKNQTEDLRLLSYKLLIEKFNEKYANLSEKQKALLKEFIYSVSTTDKFYGYVMSEIPVLKESLKIVSKNESDKVLKIKIHEVITQLDKIGTGKFIKDHELSALMVAYQIVEELKS